MFAPILEAACAAAGRASPPCAAASIACVSANAEDELIERNDHPVRLTQEEHFYSQKVFTIIVNAKAKEVVKNRPSFEDVVKLAFETPPHQSVRSPLPRSRSVPCECPSQ